ncbi:MAG: OsmC family protein [Planctomycetota bacterium]
MAEQKTIKIVNGVDTEVLHNLIDSVQEDSSLAKTYLRVRNKWVKGGHSQSTISDFYGAGQELLHDKTFVLDADEPPILAGEDKGANPMEYVLHALAGCMTTTLAYHAAVGGIEIQEIESELEGDLDIRGFMGLSEDVKKGFENIRVTFWVKTDEENIEKLRELTKFSAVFDTISTATPIDIQVEKK